MRLYVPEDEDSDDRRPERRSDVMTVARRRDPAKRDETRPSLGREQLPQQDGPLARLGGPILAVLIALWLTAGVWGPRPPLGTDTLAHLGLAEFSIDRIFGEWQLDGWQPRFNLGYEAFLFLGPGFFAAVGLVKLLSLGVLSTAGAFKVVVIASFVVVPLAVAFFARSFGLGRRTAGIAAILALAVNSPFGGVGLEGLFSWGLVLHQFGAIFLFLALGSILRLLADPGPRWTMFAAATLAALVVSHGKSVPVLGLMLLVLVAALRVPRAASALGLIRPGPIRGDPERPESGSQEPGPEDDLPVFSARVLRHVLTAALITFGLASFYLVSLLAHRDLQGPMPGWPTPPLGARVSAIVQGELLFRPLVALAVLAGWGYALVDMSRRRPYLLALAVTPLLYLAVAHWAVRQWPGNALALQLPERGLGYAGVLAILPLAALLAHLTRGRGWRGDAGAMALAAALVVIPLGSAKNIARQTSDPIPQMHEAASRLSRLVPDHARFATERDFVGEVYRTGVEDPDHWLAWASARNTLNNYAMELSPAADPPLEPERFSEKSPDAIAETLSRLGVTHVVAISDQSAERLDSSPRFTEVWRASPLAILAVEASRGQPDPANLVTFDAPGRAEVVGAEPNHIAIQIEPSRATRAALPISWSPKWHALMDGKPVDLRKASNGTMELDVPADSVRLILEFTPDWWDRLGGALTLATLALLARRRRERRRRSTGDAGPPAEVEALEEVPAASTPPVVPSRVERVTLPVTVGASPGHEHPAPSGDGAARAERVAQALLGALDGSPSNQRVHQARDQIGDGPGTLRDDRNPTP